jgi:predicted secreted protein
MRLTSTDVDFKMNIAEMKAGVRKEFTISLEANPTTGYRWEAKIDENILELKERSFEPYTPVAVGGGGKEKFTFIPIRTGETSITMRYKRPWEGAVIEEKTFRIIIT